MIASSTLPAASPLQQALRRLIAVKAVTLGTLGLVGCAVNPPGLYEWGNYQPQVYEYFKAQGKGPDDQLLKLEADLQKIRAKGASPPPGFHAHMGLLYASLGKDDQAAQSFQSEKTLFPESTVYVDFLLSKSRK